MAIIVIFILAIIIIQAFRFPELFFSDMKWALIIWLLVGAVSLFSDVKLTFDTWLIGAGIGCFGLAILFFLFQSFILGTLVTEGSSYEKLEEIEIEYVTGEVMPDYDDTHRIWNSGQILTSKAGTLPKWWQRSGEVVNDVNWSDWQTCKNHSDAHFHSYDKNGKSVCNHK